MKKKLIRRIAIITASVFLLAFVLFWIFEKMMSSARSRAHQKVESRIEKVVNENQEYLNQVAQQFKEFPADQRILSKINSEIIKKQNEIRLMLWMSDTTGAFVSGIPSPLFSRMNNFYDKYEDTAEREKYFINRDDFLNKSAVVFAENQFGVIQRRYVVNDFTREQSEIIRLVDQIKEFSHWGRKQRWVNLTTPVFNPNGKLIGNLYLVVDDIKNDTLYHRFYSGNLDGWQGFMGFLTIFSGIVLWFLLPTWVYIDARERDVKNPVWWAILQVIAPVFGTIVYFITRPATLKVNLCPSCEHEINGDRPYCPYCGFDITSVLCPECQYPIQTGWAFCPSCRTDLSKSKAEERKVEIPEEFRPDEAVENEKKK